MLNAALKPKSKFLGNSAASIMDGKGTLHNLVHSISQLPDPRRRRKLLWVAAEDRNMRGHIGSDRSGAAAEAIQRSSCNGVGGCE